MSKWIIALMALMALLVFAMPAEEGRASEEQTVRMGHLPEPCLYDIGIEIRKQSEGADSRSFASGSDVEFEIEVKNPCEHDLHNVEVRDFEVPAFGPSSHWTVIPMPPPMPQR